MIHTKAIMGIKYNINNKKTVGKINHANNDQTEEEEGFLK